MRNRFRCRDVDSVGSALSAARPTDRWPRRSRRVRRNRMGPRFRRPAPISRATGAVQIDDRFRSVCCGIDVVQSQAQGRECGTTGVQSRGGRRGRIGRDHRGGSSGRLACGAGDGARRASSSQPSSCSTHVPDWARSRPRSPHPPVRVPRKGRSTTGCEGGPTGFDILPQDLHALCVDDERVRRQQQRSRSSAYPRNPCCRETCCCIGQFVGSLVGRGGGVEDRRPIRGIGRNVLPQTGSPAFGAQRQFRMSTGEGRQHRSHLGGLGSGRCRHCDHRRGRRAGLGIGAGSRENRRRCR